jgi:hypothetical protein
MFENRLKRARSGLYFRRELCWGEGCDWGHSAGKFAPQRLVQHVTDLSVERG